MNNIIATVIAVVITLALIVVAVAVGSQALTGSSTGNTATTLSTIQNNVRSLYAGQASYAGLDNDIGLAAKLFPSNMVDPNDNVYNAWGGAVTLGTTSNDAEFTIQYDGVPTDACSSLVSYNVTGLGTITVNTSTLTPPVGVSDAVNVCGESGSGQNGGNSIQWSFY